MTATNDNENATPSAPTAADDTDETTPGSPTAAEQDQPAEPEQTFADFDVAPELVEALREKGIVNPFPIQALTLPMALDGHDIIGQARTGTGKTLAFGLPLLQRVDPARKRVQALVITPTRELTIQVADDLGIGAALGLHVTAVYGGVPIEPQTDALLGGAQVVVGTPGRLLDHVGRGNLDLSGCTQLVLDEADEMLDMGFLPDIERLVEAIGGGERHTMLFSATMPPAIVSLARRYMDSPTFLRAASDEPETAPTVDQYFMHVHRMDKPRVLARIMQTPDRGGAFVFTRTKMMASRLVGDLEAMGIAAVEVHGDLRQAARERNLDKFRRGRADILVATEVAARGLDVDNVTHVVNYDCPDDHKMYLHRIGRTARAGAKGVAVTFCEYNEIDRVNVIRKTIEAHDGEDPVEIFSSSDLLTDWFDLPEETPWAAARRKRRESRSPDEGRNGKGSSRGRSDKRDRDDRKSNDRKGDDRKSNDRKSNDRKSNDRTASRRDTAKSNTPKGDTPKGDTAKGDTAKGNGSRGASPRDRDRRGGGGNDGDRARGARDGSTPKVTGGAAAPDDETTQTRTRTRTRVREDAARGPARATTADDDRDDRQSRGGTNAKPRKRARAARPSADRKAADGKTDDASRDRGTSDRSGGQRSGGGRSGGQRSGGQRSGRTSSERGDSRRAREERSTSGGGRSTRTTSDRPTRRGDDARGDGTPGLARRVLVEHLP